MKTPEQIVQEVFAAEAAEGRETPEDSLYLTSNWDIARIMRRAIEADRAQTRVITIKGGDWRVGVHSPVDVYRVVDDLLVDYTAEDIIWEES